MDKELKTYILFIESKITGISKQLEKENNNPERINKEIQELTDYHNQTIRNFQHERFIHLIVTFFFAGLLLLSIFISILFTSSPMWFSGTVLTNLSLCISAILLITELFYIKHYYILENYTQSLYKYSKNLYEISQNKPNC